DARKWLEYKGKGTVYQADPNGLWGGGNHKPIYIEVSTGTYQVEIKSEKWVPVKQFNTDVSVLNPGDIAQLPDIYLTMAGRLEGKIKLPNGSYFEAKEIDPSQGGGWTEAEIQIIGIDVDYQNRAEMRQWSLDPTKFIFDALPPGKYNLIVRVRKGEMGDKDAKEIYPPAVVQGVRVSAGQTTFLEVVLKDGVKCEPIAPIPPEKPEVDYSPRSTTSVLMYGIIALPSDVSLKGNDILSLAKNKGITEDLYVNLLEYDYQNKIWKTSKLPEGKYNFYMAMMRMFGPEGLEEEGMSYSPDEYMVVISRAENVNVKSDDLAQGSTFQIKMGAGVMGSGIFTGRVKGKNIFLQKDAEKIKGNFNEFLKCLPTVMLYDMEGKWRAYGGVYPENNKQENLMKWVIAVMSGDVGKLNELVNSDDPNKSSPVHFYIDNLPLGKYVMVCETKNYPPITKIVTISTGTTVLNINFDEDAPQGAKLTGYVKDENNNPIKEANVTITHRLVTKRLITDSNGKFEITGLPTGICKIDVTKSGYAIGGEKVSLGKEDKEVTIKLKTASAKISGKIYVRESNWGKKNIYTGAKVVAYNETENVTNPGKYLPSITVKTDSDGSYLIPDIILGNTYYVYAFIPQKPVYYRLVYVSSNTMANIDFDIKPSTPTLKIITKRTENPYVFKFIIESPRPLIDRNTGKLAPPE
ncbi:MAG: carboxypeptidase regulatory-like domain-containing protein, partial [Endomicrobiia bacterium]